MEEGTRDRLTCLLQFNQPFFIHLFVPNLLLTERAQGPQWGMLAQGRGSRDRVQRGPCKNDGGPIIPNKTQ